MPFPYKIVRKLFNPFFRQQWSAEHSRNSPACAEQSNYMWNDCYVKDLCHLNSDAFYQYINTSSRCREMESTDLAQVTKLTEVFGNHLVNITYKKCCDLLGLQKCAINLPSTYKIPFALYCSHYWVYHAYQVPWISEHEEVHAEFSANALLEICMYRESRKALLTLWWVLKIHVFRNNTMFIVPRWHTQWREVPVVLLPNLRYMHGDSYILESLWMPWNHFSSWSLIRLVLQRLKIDNCIAFGTILLAYQYWILFIDFVIFLLHLFFPF